jgi:hypothetical protein
MPQFIAVASFIALISGVSFYDLANLNFAAFCHVFLKLINFYYCKIVLKKRQISLADPIIFR